VPRYEHQGLRVVPIIFDARAAGAGVSYPEGAAGVRLPGPAPAFGGPRIRRSPTGMPRSVADRVAYSPMPTLNARPPPPRMFFFMAGFSIGMLVGYMLWKHVG